MLARYLASRTVVRSFSAAAAPPKVAPFHYQPLFDLAPDTTTKYKKLENASKHVQVQDLGGNKFLKVGPEALRILSAQGAHLDRVWPWHICRRFLFIQLFRMLSNPTPPPSHQP